MSRPLWPTATLALWVAAGVLAAPSARAQSSIVRLSSKVNAYVDNDGNQVVTPTTHLEADSGEHLTLRAGAAFDVMTCASVDVVSAATPKGYFEETREEYSGGMSLHFDRFSTDLGTIYSRENDYSSITGSLGMSAELFKRNTTLTFGYSFTDSNVGRAGDAGFDRDLNSHTATASITQTLTPHLIVQGGYFVGYLGGYQSSPYRAVAFRSGAHAPERVPTDRLRQSLVVRARWSPSKTTFVGADYRIYTDTWGLLGHTAQLTFTHQPVDWFSWRLRDRFYGQKGTDFYQETYDRNRAYMTADRELGPFVANLIGAKVSFTPPALTGSFRLSADLKADLNWQWFSEFAKLPTRIMLVTELGLRLDY